MNLQDKIDKYLNEASSRVFPIPEMEIQEIIYDFAVGSEYEELFDEFDYEKGKEKPKKETQKVEKKVMTIVNRLEKAMNNPKNIKSMARADGFSEFKKITRKIIKDYAKSIKGKHDVANAFYSFTREKEFMDSLENFMIELYQYIDKIRDKWKY